MLVSLERRQEIQTLIGGTKLTFESIKNCKATYRADSSILGKPTIVVIDLRELSDDTELEQEHYILFHRLDKVIEIESSCVIYYSYR